MRNRVPNAPDNSRPTGGRDYTNEGVGLPLQREQATRLLPALVGRLGLEFYDRGNVPELPYVLWEAVTARNGQASAFPSDEIALLRALAVLAGGWVAYETSGELVFQDCEQWQRAWRAWRKPRAK